MTYRSFSLLQCLYILYLTTEEEYSPKRYLKVSVLENKGTMIVLRERANSNDINTNIVICKRHFGKDKYFTFRWWFFCHMSNYRRNTRAFFKFFFYVDNISIRTFMHKNLTSRIFIVILCNTCLNCHLRGNKRLQSKKACTVSNAFYADANFYTH